MNPARSLGPALVSGQLSDVWIYVIGPFLGAALAVAVNLVVHGSTENDPRARQAAQGKDADPSVRA